MNTQTNIPVKKSNKEVKVLAINTLYQYAKQFFEYEKQHFSQFIGKDIFKVDGSIKAKFEHDKLSFTGTLEDGTNVNAHYWFTSKYNCFDIHIKICVNGGSYDVKPSTAFCQYEETTLTMFKIVENNLIETPANIDFLNTRYDVETLVKIAADIKEAAKIYEAAENKMPYLFKGVFDIERLTR